MTNAPRSRWDRIDANPRAIALIYYRQMSRRVFREKIPKDCGFRNEVAPSINETRRLRHLRSARMEMRRLSRYRRRGNAKGRLPELAGNYAPWRRKSGKKHNRRAACAPESPFESSG